MRDWANKRGLTEKLASGGLILSIIEKSKDDKQL